MEKYPPSRDVVPLTNIEVAAGLQRAYRSFGDKGYRLDWHQEAAIEAIGTALMQGERSGYVEMATGSGKTLLEALLAEAAVNAGKRVLMLGSSIQIASQLSGADGKTGLGKFTNMHAHGDVRHHFGTRRGTASSPVVVSTYQGLLNEVKSDAPRLGEFDMIIADECHRSLGPETSRALVEYMPGALKLGFSATPDYAVDRRSDEVYGTSLFEYSLLDAVEAGVTAPVRPLLLETGQMIELSDVRREFSETELAPLIENMERNGIALQLVEGLARDGRQGVVACVPGLENGHARLMARMIASLTNDERIISASDVGSHLSPEEQQKRIAAFERGEIDVLTFTRSLEEGWDSAVANFCINLAPTTSPVRTKQLLGRILRKNPDGRESVYVDFVDMKSGIDKQQYTAYHALGLEDIDIHRHLGKGHAGIREETSYKHLTNIDKLFNDKIQDLLRQSQGKSVRDVLLTKTSERVDPLTATWERRLAEEGMPAELDYNVALPTTVHRELGKAAARFARREGYQPDFDETVEEARLTQWQENLVAEYGERVEWDDNYMNSLPEQDEMVDTIADTIRQDEVVSELNAILTNRFSEREEGVIRMRYGVATPQGSSGVRPTQPMTLDDIGLVYGVGRERVRQIESKTMSKLRHPSVSGELRSMVGDAAPELVANDLPNPMVTGLLDKDAPKYPKDILEAANEQYASYLRSMRSSEVRQYIAHMSDATLAQRQAYAYGLVLQYDARTLPGDMPVRDKAVQRLRRSQVFAQYIELNSEMKRRERAKTKATVTAGRQAFGLSVDSPFDTDPFASED